MKSITFLPLIAIVALLLLTLTLISFVALVPLTIEASLVGEIGLSGFLF